MKYHSMPFLLLIVFLASPSQAQVCTVSTTGLALGQYDQLKNQNTYGEGRINVVCDAGLPFTILMDAGQNSKGTFSPRRMAGGKSLAYNLFTDGAHSMIWGDSTDGTYVRGGSGSANFPVYGMIPARQIVPVGTYTDVVIVTVQW